MSIRWSKEQLAAIESVDHNVIVSASAGAGKTTVLVARLTKRLLVDRISVDRILAMTFTEAAAAEMKKKLTISLTNAYQKDPDPWLAKQLALLADADISTIHSFCLKLIQKYYYVIGIDASIATNVLDEATATYYRKEAIRMVLKEAYDAPSAELLDLLQRQSSASLSTNNLVDSIKRLADAALSHYDYEKWLDTCVDQYQSYASLKELPEALRMLFWAYLNENFNRYLDCLLDAKQAFSDTNETLPINQIETRLEHAKEIQTAIQNQDYSAFREGYRINTALPVKSVQKHPGSSLVSEAHRTYQKLVGDLYEERDLLADIAMLRAPIVTLCQLTKQYIKRYDAMKKELKALEFDDMERYALAILYADHGAVARLLQEHYIDIMVDEFQDTNYTQDELIRLIARKNNVFRVGDIKQSIYRFRKARPEIMQRLLQEAGAEDEVIHLNQNFRSSASLIQFNNELFNRLMNLPNRPVYFPPEDRVSPGTDAQSMQHDPAVFCMINKDSMKAAGYRSEAQAKANYIAQEIMRIKTEEPHWHWRDFAVLVSTNKTKAIVQDTLNAWQIPAYGGVSFRLYETAGIKALRSFLTLLWDPQNAIAFASVLVAFWQFSDDQLAELSATKFTLASLRASYPVIADTIEGLIEKAKTGYLSELINEILCVNQFYELHNNQQQKANLDLFLETADRYSAQGGSIAGFLQLVEELTEEDVKEASSMNEEDDAVKIMSIHQSKGLEFPIVFFFSKNRANSPMSGFAKIHPDYGVTLPATEFPQRYTRSSVYEMALAYAEKQESTEESIRVLYVALTRAKQRMYLVDVYEDIEEQWFSSATLSTHSYTSWMMSALEPNSAYRVMVVDSLPPMVQAGKKEQTEPVEYPRYKAQDVMTEVLSPSATETDRSDTALHFYQGEAAADIGTLVHQAFEALPEEVWTLETIQSVLGERLHAYTQAFISFAHSALYQEMLSGTIHKELPFLVRIREQIVHGYIDMIAVTEQSVILVDYKTDRDVTPELLLERYSSQINLYKEAMHIIYPDKEICAYLYSLTLCSFIEL